MHSLNESKKWTTKLSSAGLVYAHFGREVIARVLGWKLDDPNVEKIYDKVYENFMEEIDAIDNGVKMFDEEPRSILFFSLQTISSFKLVFGVPRFRCVHFTMLRIRRRRLLAVYFERILAGTTF